jgi:peptidoglycan/LPS O-acetylase OafA/YrhL
LTPKALPREALPKKKPLARSGRGGVIRKDRLTHLDGLRGVAAVAVVAHHFCLAFAPAMQPFQAKVPHWLFDTPLALLYNGSFAVGIFFVVSGFVVANAGAAGKSPLPVSLIVRYLRLAVPATVSVIYAWALLSLFRGAPRELNALLPNGWLYQTYWDKIPGLDFAIPHGLYGVFVAGSSHYNNPLWTMQTELIGSFAILIAYAFTRGWGRPVAVIALGALALYLGQKQFLTFAAGALLREVWAADRLPARPALFALAAGMLLGAPLQQAAMRLHITAWPFFGDLGVTLGLTAITAALLIVYATLASPLLRDLFSARVPAFLGRISFSLYLVHVPLIMSVCAWLYVRAAPVSPVEVAGGFVALLAVSLALAWAMTKWIDDPFVSALTYARRNYPRVFAALMPRKSDIQGQG